jgi:hypothetical protein
MSTTARSIATLGFGVSLIAVASIGLLAPSPVAAAASSGVRRLAQSQAYTPNPIWSKSAVDETHRRIMDEDEIILSAILAAVTEGVL